ncbi:MAG: carboxymuconolactone decarboxylase family protein [Sphingomonadaceae bacterium]|nr:carboxymuconolactone decarboxylase family protein [Sphingomonadaceae bacterium]
MLFRIVGTSERALDKFLKGALLDRGPLPIRERELVVFRTAAQIGADYEWGMHAAIFAERCDIDETQLDALAKQGDDADCWTEAEAALIASVDALIARRKFSDAEFDRLAVHFPSDQIMEIVQLVGFYQSVALIIGAFDIAPEPGTPTIPS